MKLSGGFNFWKSDLLNHPVWEDESRLDHVVYKGPIGYNKHLTVYKHSCYALVTEIFLESVKKWSSANLIDEKKWNKSCNYLKISETGFIIEKVIFQANMGKFVAILSKKVNNEGKSQEIICILNKETNSIQKIDIPKVSSIREPNSETID